MSARVLLNLLENNYKRIEMQIIQRLETLKGREPHPDDAQEVERLERELFKIRKILGDNVI